MLLSLAPPADVAAQSRDTDSGMKTVLGPRNPDLSAGAQALLSGEVDEGIRLTRLGLDSAFGDRERVAGLSNLCAGYIRKHDWQAALGYCDEAIELDSDSWRARTNRALVYVFLGEFEKAEADLAVAEERAPGAASVKQVRSKYRDATDPVIPSVTIDDRRDPDDDRR